MTHDGCCNNSDVFGFDLPGNHDRCSNDSELELVEYRSEVVRAPPVDDPAAAAAADVELPYMESLGAEAVADTEETETPGVVCPATALPVDDDVEATETPGVDVPLGVLPCTAAAR